MPAAPDHTSSEVEIGIMGMNSAGSGNGLIRAAIARDQRNYDQRRAEVVRDVRAGRITKEQAEDRMNNR